MAWRRPVVVTKICQSDKKTPSGHLWLVDALDWATALMPALRVLIIEGKLTISWQAGDLFGTLMADNGRH
jgi:hypothetical protein